MHYKVIGSVIAARLDIDEEIVQSIKLLCEKLQVKSAVVHGIGAVKSAKTGIFDFESGAYKENQFDKFAELISLDGNVTEMDGEKYIHLHASFGDENGNTFGGHLKSAIIGATCELFIMTLDETIHRFHDEKTGLNLFDI